MRLAALWGLALPLVGGCVDTYRGAIVHLNLRQLERSAEGEHYALYAVVNGGAVALEAFTVINTLQGCGLPPDLSADLDLVARYDNGASRAELCAPERRMGLVDKIDLASASLAGGVKINTPVDLREAESVFVSVEPDGDEDPRPGPVVLRADLGDGVAPHRAVARQCRLDFCEGLDAADPLVEQFCGEAVPEVPRAQRGVRRGVLLRVPADGSVGDPCNAAEAGEIAVVPAEDETFL